MFASSDEKAGWFDFSLLDGGKIQKWVTICADDGRRSDFSFIGRFRQSARATNSAAARAHNLFARKFPYPLRSNIGQFHEG